MHFVLSSPKWICNLLSTNHFQSVENYLFRTASILWEWGKSTPQLKIPAFKKTIVIRNGKIVWKHGPIVDIFAWTWNIWGGCMHREHIKGAQNGGFCEKLLSENGCFSHFLLLWLWCQRFWGSSENRCRNKKS